MPLKFSLSTPQAKARVLAALLLLLGFCLAPALAESPPASAPAQQATPAAPPPNESAAPAVPQPGDTIGEETTMPERTIVYRAGESDWDSAFDTIVASLKSVDEYLAQQGIKPTGPPLVIYTETDDRGFQFHAAVPIAAPPQQPPSGDIAVGQSPSGKALKFVHRGSYDSMDQTYDAITDFLDDRHLEAKDLFVEEYVTDPVTTPPDRLVVNIYVPLK